MLTDAQVQDYLERIGFVGTPEVDSATLSELIRRHQSSIPFETVTLHRSGKTPSVEVDDLYRKMVAGSFGGYCFELNKLFTELLRAIGFDVEARISRAVRGRDGLMPINHRSIVVNLPEGAYSADVGFGGPMPAGALLLADGAEQDIADETYIARAAEPGWWHIDRITRAGADLFDDEVPERRQTELALCDARVEEVDFDALNLFFSRPGTLFRDHEIVNLRTDDGYLGLKDGVLTRRAGGQKEVIELDSRDAVDDALEDVFGMHGTRNL